MKLKQGIVIAVANNYADVKVNDKFYQAHIRQKVKTNGTLLVGDQVGLTMIDNNQAVIEKIFPRTNELYRPRITNINQVVIVNALTKPTFNTLILNKLLTLFNFYQIDVVLAFTKTDLVKKTDSVWKKIKYYQELKYPCYFVSNNDKVGIEDLSVIFKNKFSLLTGVSGVGKSSLLNSLEPSLNLTTNEISLTLKHGKHTTTTTKLYFLLDGIIADSPGFMVLKLQGLTKFDLALNFPVIKAYVNKCKFNNCLHQNEPGCAVVKNLNDKLNKYFYQDYCKILLEFINLH